MNYLHHKLQGLTELSRKPFVVVMGRVLRTAKDLWSCEYPALEDDMLEQAVDVLLSEHATPEEIERYINTGYWNNDGN